MSAVASPTEEELINEADCQMLVAPV